MADDPGAAKKPKLTVDSSDETVFICSEGGMVTIYNTKNNNYQWIPQNTGQTNNSVTSEDFELLTVLGTGGKYNIKQWAWLIKWVWFVILLGYGKVFLVRKVSGNNNGRLFAMKVLKKQRVLKKRKVMEHTLTERFVLEAIRDSPFLVTLHYAFQTESKLHLIMGQWAGLRMSGQD